MSSNSKVAVTISKNSCWNLLHPCIAALLQRYFNKIALGITITFDSIVERSAHKPYIECPTVKKRFRQGSNQGFSRLKFEGPLRAHANGFIKTGYHHPMPL